ncbi:hypothetical protein [Pantoea agglomerans]|uniref:hypothetical protein n=1 Tax=Enterobacter agglomerans TaxID=549 RepID=UPI0024137A23|nr:hypothetical protein [Pantoea agglomerans]
MIEQRKPDGGLAEWIEVLEDDRADNAELLCLLLELRRHREDLAAKPRLPLCGWKLVPVEPTTKQWAAGVKAMDAGIDKPTLCYRAMLAAAPEVENAK